MPDTLADMLATLRRQPVALSVRQPWADAIISAGKDVENRSWMTRFRGPVLIHAGRQTDGPVPAACRRGGIIGMAVITDCVTAWPSQWWMGPYGFALAAATPLRFIPCRGRLGFFTPLIDPQALEVLNV